MINFRYHIVSLIAVFLALAIGVIMGSAVIDRAIVDRLEDQQASLEERIGDVEVENDSLREENQQLTESASLLAEQGSQRLLAGALVDVAVLVIATRGVEDGAFDGLLSLLQTSGSDQRGTIWLTDRFALDGDDEVRDLAGALDAPESLGANSLRTLALTRLSTMLRTSAGPAPIDDPSVAATTSTTIASEPAAAPGPTVLAALRDAGFVDFDAPDGEPDDVGPVLRPGTRIVLVSGARSEVAVDTLAVPFAELLVTDRSGVPSVALLAAEERPATEDVQQVFVAALRGNDEVAGRLSSVDDIGDFAGRLAAVLAIVDLGEGRIGHYGSGPGAQRFLPAPPESEG
jgi:hypothetical protein